MPPTPGPLRFVNVPGVWMSLLSCRVQKWGDFLERLKQPLCHPAPQSFSSQTVLDGEGANESPRSRLCPPTNSVLPLGRALQTQRIQENVPHYQSALSLNLPVYKIGKRRRYNLYIMKLKLSDCVSDCPTTCRSNMNTCGFAHCCVPKAPLRACRTEGTQYL